VNFFSLISELAMANYKEVLSILEGLVSILEEGLVSILEEGLVSILEEGLVLQLVIV
jgi:hypothetical protein